MATTRKFSDQEIIRRKKLSDLIANNNDPFRHLTFAQNTNSLTFKKKYEKLSKDQLSNVKDKINIAGRIMAIRQGFGVIKDDCGQVQFYLDRKNSDTKVVELFDHSIDIGDIIGINGTPMKTNSGEVTIRVKKLTILSKSLHPWPEKWHGLVDEEEKSRRRYIDLVMNDQAKQNFLLRSKIITAINEFMSKQGFIAVDTPILQGIKGGAIARPFITKHNALNRNFYLRVASELHLKRLIIGGMDKVYEIGRMFRNEGMDTTHNPEFTTMEAYWAYVSMTEWMALTEKMFSYICDVLDKKKVTFRGMTVDLKKPFRRIKMTDFIKKETKIDFDREIKNDQDAIAIAKKHQIELLPHQKNRGHIVSLFFEKYCEEKCVEPTIVYGYPIEISPLAKKMYEDPRYVERFELFICGKEFANCYSELNDPIDQLERFKSQVAEKEHGNDEADEIDYEFVEALEYGMPPTGGIGFGIDRLIMLFTNQDSIRNVLLFPHLREEKK